MSSVELRNQWQEGRADEYQLIDQATCELMGYSALTFAIELLKALCERVADLSGGVKATEKLQLACFPAGADGYDAHTDGSAYEDLDDSMPSDQRAMISSRIGRVPKFQLLQENHSDPLPECASDMMSMMSMMSSMMSCQEEWDDSDEGALRAHGASSHFDVTWQSTARMQITEVMPEGGSLVLFRSRDLLHEVMSTKRDRYALTMWYVS